MEIFRMQRAKKSGSINESKLIDEKHSLQSCS